MPDTTPHLGLPLIAAGQAQKHVTHNEALGLIDALVQLACLDKDLASPPANPAEGDRYLVAAAAPTGAWAGLSGQVARFADGVWVGSAPAPGWFAYVLDEADLYIFTGQAWTSFRAAITAIQLTSRLGINTGADATNRLAVKSDAALFSWDDVTPGSGNMRQTVNKKAAGNDAGFVFQTGYSTRALFGTLGGDDVVLKTSPDGATFNTALTAAAATGAVGFPASPTAPTPAAADNSTKLATTAYVDRAMASSAWTAYAPTVTAGNGAALTTGTVGARYQLVGKTLRLHLDVPITAGGGSGGTKVTLPPGSTFQGFERQGGFDSGSDSGANTPIWWLGNAGDGFVTAFFQAGPLAHTGVTNARLIGTFSFEVQ